MNLRCRAIAVALGVLLVAGCGPESNEEGIIGGAKVVPTKPGMEHIKTYGEIKSYEAEQAKKRMAEKKSKSPSKGPRP
jgi:hypothetical protein